MSTRIDSISEEVMKALPEAMRSVKDPRVQSGLVSVVHCEVTNDLDVYKRQGWRRKAGRGHARRL